MLDNLEWETLVKNKNSICNVFQDHQRPSGYSIIQLPHTSQQQDEIQPLKEDAAVPYKIRCFQVVSFLEPPETATIAETPTWYLSSGVCHLSLSSLLGSEL